MKGLIAVAMLLVLIAGVAVGGSRAQPVPKVSPALTICSPTGPIAPDTRRCQPVIPAQAEVLAFVGERAFDDFANEAVGIGDDPENLGAVIKAIFEVAWRAAVAAASVNFVQRAMDWAFGEDPTNALTLAGVDTTIFDPSY